MKDRVYYNKYGFDVPSEHLPTTEELESYARGEDFIVDTLVRGVTQFVLNIVEKYVAVNKHAKPHVEDLRSEALLHTVTVVRQKLGSRFTTLQFLAYIKRSVQGCLHDWLRECVPTITVVSETQTKARKESRNILGTKVQLKQSHHITEEDSVFSEVWFDDFVASLDSVDADILRYRIQGLSNRETGIKVGLHHTTVEQHLEKIRKSYMGV